MIPFLADCGMAQTWTVPWSYVVLALGALTFLGFCTWLGHRR